MKTLTKDIYNKVKKNVRSAQPVASTSEKQTMHPKDTSIAAAAKRATNRQEKLGLLKNLLKIECLNIHALKLLRSPPYKAYLAEKIMYKLAAKSADNVAANFNRIFFLTQFAKRAVANLYWGDDNR